MDNNQFIYPSLYYYGDVMYGFTPAFEEDEVSGPGVFQGNFVALLGLISGNSFYVDSSVLVEIKQGVVDDVGTNVGGSATVIGWAGARSVARSGVYRFKQATTGE